MAARNKTKRLTFMLLRGIAALGLVSLAVVMLVIVFLYRPILQNQTLEEAVATGDILAAQIDLAVRGLVDYSDFYVDSAGLNGALENYEREPGETAAAAVSDELGQLQPSDVHNALILRDGVLLASVGELTEADWVMLNADWTIYIKDGSEEVEFSPFYNNDKTQEAGNRILYLRNFTCGGKRYTLGLICSTEQMERDILRLSDGLFSGYTIATMSGPVFFSYGELSNTEEILERHTTDLSFRDRDETGYYIASTIPSNSWKVVAYLSNEQFNASFTPVLIAALLMCLLVCTVLILLVWPFSQRLLKPVGALRDAMERATQGDLKVRVTTRQQNEIGQLGDYFNHMLNEIQTSRAKELETQRKTQQMRYDLLVSQINAHYIYNTMSSVNSLARLGRCEDVIRVNSALIRILQNNLHIREGEIFSSVQTEVDTADSYWSIESLRPNNQAQFESHVEESVLHVPLLKSILQPLIENSLHHGLLDEDTGVISGRICLTIDRTDGFLRVRVSDNGKGIPPDRLRELNDPRSAWQNDGRHIGIPNIKKRLFFVFQDRASFHIRSEGGTQVEILCPVCGLGKDAFEKA